MPISPDSVPAGALAIISTLQQNGFQTCLAGGCVRDLLLQRQPSDWDIATAATPKQVEALFERTVPIGKAFGIIMVIAEDGPYEVATFRGDGVYSDGRRPDRIFFTNIVEDAKRRDFTINAMFYDPLARTLHDFCGGRADLHHRLLRAVGDPERRFAEDKLRLLRTIRFAASLDFDIDPQTWWALTAAAHAITVVASERIAAELHRMLTDGHAATAFRLLHESGLLPPILPEVAALHGVRQPPEFHPEGDVWQHTLLMLEHWDKTCRRCRAANPDAPRFNATGELAAASAAERLALAWAGLLHDVGKPSTYSESDRIRFNGHDALGATLATHILKRLRQANELCESVEKLVAGHMSLTSYPMMRLATRRQRLQDPLFPLHLELHRLDCVGSHAKLDLHARMLQDWQEEQSRPPAPPPLLRGDDLKQLGYRPGPLFKTILDAVQQANLEHILPGREEALEWVREHFRPDE